MYIKIMTDQNGVPDSDSRATFRLLEGADVEFTRDPANALCMVRVDEYWYDMDGGNAYVMNEAGKTVAHFGACPPAEYMTLGTGTTKFGTTNDDSYIKEPLAPRKDGVVDEVLRDNFVASHLCQGPNGSTPTLPHAVLPDAYHEAYSEVDRVGFIAPDTQGDKHLEPQLEAPCGGRPSSSFGPEPVV